MGDGVSLPSGVICLQVYRTCFTRSDGGRGASTSSSDSIVCDTLDSSSNSTPLLDPSSGLEGFLAYFPSPFVSGI
uniref:SFRICE_009184 n=1 Tax=Spodoptera frugiperda TaxID=7108 RepID=A0A2H1V9S1_SPOFR